MSKKFSKFTFSASKITTSSISFFIYSCPKDVNSASEIASFEPKISQFINKFNQLKNILYHLG